MKAFIKGIPVIGPTLVRLRQALVRFEGSSDYWEGRYEMGGNSGAGSYGRLAEFKANFLNTFVEQHQIQSVIEYGCGDGAQLILARYASYTGIDVSSKAVEMCRTRFADDTSKRFLEWNELAPDSAADLSLSLDVIYHLVEDSTFEAYMRRLFASARRFVIVYSSNKEEDSVVKWVRHREFTRWVERHQPEWRLHSTLKNAYPYDPASSEPTSFADFYVFTLRSEPSDR
jgi:hypothetical protein